MQRTGLSMLLVVAVMFAAAAQGQRMGAAPRAFVPHRPGMRTLVPRHSQFRRLHRNEGFVFAPIWFGDPFGYDYDYDYAEPVVPPTPMIMQVERPEQLQPPAPAATPKIIEVPGVPNASAKPQALTVFVLANGQRLEGRRYLLTADILHITVGREQRMIPIHMLDVDATVMANHERGVDLRIPSDRNEISMSF